MSAASVRRALLHPLFLLSAVLLVLNDRVLKGGGVVPGVLTGKLSDVAGLVVAPLVLAVLFRVSTRRGLAVAHVVVGAGFTAFELSEGVTSIGRTLFASWGLHWHATRDLTDLLALAALAPAFLVFARAAEETRASAGGRRALERITGGAALLACAASSDPDTPPVWQPTNDNDNDGWETFEDCNDFDANVNPGNGNCPGDTEHCGNGVDDNGDEAVDCDDPDCSFACAATFSACEAAEPATLGQSVMASTEFDPTWALEGSCGGADAPEQIFLFTTTEVVKLTVVPPPGHVVYVREACDEAILELGCATFDEEAEMQEPLVVELDSTATYALVVDAIDSGETGPFELELAIEPTGPACGNGTLDASEGCDDGNLDNGDGCNLACEPEGVGCLGALALPATTTSYLVGSQVTFDAVSSCGGGGGEPALETNPDHWFGFVAPADGTLELVASSDTTNITLSTRFDDDPNDLVCATEEETCEAPQAPGQPIVTTVPLTAGSALSVIVEAAADAGPDAQFTLVGVFTPSTP